jgi:hypothetical protein
MDNEKDLNLDQQAAADSLLSKVRDGALDGVISGDEKRVLELLLEPSTGKPVATNPEVVSGPSESAASAVSSVMEDVSSTKLSSEIESVLKALNRIEEIAKTIGEVFWGNIQKACEEGKSWLLGIQGEIDSGTFDDSLKIEPTVRLSLTMFVELANVLDQYPCDPKDKENLSELCDIVGGKLIGPEEVEGKNCRDVHKLISRVRLDQSLTPGRDARVSEVLNWGLQSKTNNQVPLRAKVVSGPYS